MRANIVLTAMLTALLLMAAACETTAPSQGPSPEPASTPAPAAPTALASTPTPSTAPTPVPNRTSTDAGSIVVRKTDHFGKAVASIEERIYLSDVVVKARLVSAGEDVLNFRSIEYLKGTGPAKFSVRAETEGRDTGWDNVDGILFLTPLTGEAQDFAFTDTTNWSYLPTDSIIPIERFTPEANTYTGNLPEGYTVGTRNPVWLPTTQAGSTPSSGTRNTSSQAPRASDSVITTEYDGAGSPQTVTQSDLEGLVRWTVGPNAGVASGGAPDGTTTRSATDSGTTNQAVIDAYNFCMLNAMSKIRKLRDSEAVSGPWVHARWEERIPSGDAQVKLIHWPRLRSGNAPHTLDPDNAYDRHLLYDGDAHLFASRNIDDDDTPRNGYTYELTPARPLPAGTYSFKFKYYPHDRWACEFDFPENFVYVDVTVTAPAGTVHEAFFDPATTTAGVGYVAGSATTTGVLKPTVFSVHGRAVTTTGLEWRNGQVVLTLEPFATLRQGFIIIEPNGSLGVVLSGAEATTDRAAGTMSWVVAERPWASGDELMLRIAPLTPPSVRSLTAEVNSEGLVVLRWEVPYSAGVRAYRIWRHRPSWDDGPKIYVSDTLSAETTYTDTNTLPGSLTEYSVAAIDRSNAVGERSEPVRIGGQ